MDLASDIAMSAERDVEQAGDAAAGGDNNPALDDVKEKLGGLWGFVSAQSGALGQVLKSDLSEFATTLRKDVLGAEPGGAGAGGEDGAAGEGGEEEDEEDEDTQIAREIAENARAMAGNLAGNAASALGSLTKQVQGGLGGIMGMPVADDEHDFDVSAAPAQSDGTYNRAEMRKREIQTSMSTYVTDPSDEDGFDDFEAGLDLTGKRDEIASILAENHTLRAMHTRLVPERVSYGAFWTRYFFRMHKLDHEEAKRKKAALAAAADDDDDDLGWGDDDEEEAEEEQNEANGDKEKEEKEEEKQEARTEEVDLDAEFDAMLESDTAEAEPEAEPESGPTKGDGEGEDWGDWE